MHDYLEFKTNRLDNGHIFVDYLTTAGPRIIRLGRSGRDENLLAHVPDAVTETPNGPYRFLGGHRLWHAPESLARTYISDSSGLSLINIATPASPQAIRLSAPVESQTGIQKEIDLVLAQDTPALTLTHRITNHGLWPVTLAAWAITQLELGGIGVLPQLQGPSDQDGMLPNRSLALWPYTSWQDPRLNLQDDYIFIHANMIDQPFKVGQLNRHGWLGYFWKDIFFEKSFTPDPSAAHYDMGSNSEIYCNHAFIELETLSPIVTVEPSETIEHTERWSIVNGLSKDHSAKNMRSFLAHRYGTS